jgi:hypothetical protein
MRKVLSLAVVALLMFIVGAAMACGDDDDGGGSTSAPTDTSDGDTGGSTSTYCADLDELDAALANLDSTIGSGAGPDAIEQAADEVEAAFRQVENSAEGEIDELEASFDTMNSGVRDEEAVAAAALIDDVDASVSTLQADANC